MMQALRQLNTAQRVFLMLPTMYFIFLCTVAIYRSQNRHSVLLTSDAVSDTEAPAAVEAPTRLQLQDFHRVEVKNGRPVWEVHAKDARYYPEALVTHVNDALFTLFRQERSSITVKSRAAKLATVGEAVGDASLEGQVEVKVGNDITVTSETADYQAAKRKITIPGSVSITGQGFVVRGVGLVYDMDKELLSLSEDVECTFEPQAKVPRQSALTGSSRGSSSRTSGPAENN